MLYPPYRSNFSILACLDIAQREYNRSSRNPIFVKSGGTCKSQLACLTLEGCWELCGGDIRGNYELSDVFNTIATWVFPLFLLAGNINYVKIGGISYFNYFVVLMHILGDPIDTILSLSLKIDVGRRACMYYLRKAEAPSVPWWRMIFKWTPSREAKNFAIVALALDDFNFENRDGVLWNWFPTPGSAFGVTARWLGDVRGMSVFRAGLAVFSYLFGVAVAYVRLQNSDLPAQTSHTIALRVLYFWLIPAVILSAVAGKFPSEWTSYEILMHLKSGCENTPRSNNGQSQNLTAGAPESSPWPYNLGPIEPWTGGNYNWRPKKELSWRTAGYCLIAFLCVGLSFGVSFWTSWRTPTRGIGCRGLVELFYFVAWILSFLFTYFGQLWPWGGSFGFWIVVLVKDTLLAVPMIAVLLGAFQGWWNSCWCWSAPYSNVRMLDLDMRQSLGGLWRHFGLFPKVITVTLVAQFLLVYVLLRLSFVRLGFTDDERRESPTDERRESPTDGRRESPTDGRRESSTDGRRESPAGEEGIALLDLSGEQERNAPE